MYCLVYASSSSHPLTKPSLLLLLPLQVRSQLRSRASKTTNTLRACFKWAGKKAKLPATFACLVTLRIKAFCIKAPCTIKAFCIAVSTPCYAWVSLLEYSTVPSSCCPRMCGRIMPAAAQRTKDVCFIARSTAALVYAVQQCYIAAADCWHVAQSLIVFAVHAM
jgi:hypothetical protein